MMLLGSITLIQEAKKQSMQWKHPDYPPKKFRRVSSAGKVMTSNFWDSQVVIMVDFSKKVAG